MRRALLAVSALVAISALAALGCVGDRWAQDGGTEAQLAQDKAACERVAKADPGTTRAGLGATRPDLSGTATVPSGVDLTLGVKTSTARTDAFDRCMAERGWRRR